MKKITLLLITAALALSAQAQSTAFSADNFPRPMVVADVAVSTFAGQSSAGLADGNGANAKFNAPVGLAIDASGNIYVADSQNNRIRKVTSGADVTTVTATPQQFLNPQALCIDATGNIFFIAGARIEKLSSNGVVTDFAGAQLGSADGTGIHASFNNPSDIVIDALGNLYVADNGNHTIRKITPGAVVTTIAGTAGTSGFAEGPGTSALFKYPHGLALEASGNLLVADLGNNRIRRVTPTGNTGTVAGSDIAGNTDGNTNDAQFNSPFDVTVDPMGNIFVADYQNYSIRKIDYLGQVTTLAGSSYGNADGSGANAKFAATNSIVIDATGNLFVSDGGNNSIRKVVQGIAAVSAKIGTNLQISPNPAAQAMRISGLNAPALIIIANAAGQKVYEGTVQPGASTDIGGLSAGVYSVRVGETVLRLVKQ